MTYYICILDFEATCWADSRNDSIREIIEFPSVLYKINWKAESEFVSEFSAYVKPVRSPVLSEFCIKLTGITQANVDKADTFEVVYANHYKWLCEHVPDLNKLIMFTCGYWDLRVMLPLETSRYKLKLHYCYKKYVNVSDAFNFLYNKNAGGMANMLVKLGIELEGRHHSGIDDSRNIAKIVLQMIADGMTYKDFVVFYPKGLT